MKYKYIIEMKLLICSILSINRDLSSNQLIGPIPESIGNLKSLIKL